MSDLTAAAVVTGGSRGIGKAIALTLARQGFLVYLTYVSKAAEAQATVEEIEKAGGKAKAFQMDVSDSASVQNFFQNEVSGKVLLSALINNAGAIGDKLIVRMKDEDWDKVVGINMRGPFLCLREAAKIMIKQRQGSIVNLVSVVGITGNAGQASYSSAKAGLIGLTKSAAKELALRNIRVNAVAPGFISTDMTDSLSPEIHELYLKQIPLNRFGSAQDVADAAAFLASDKAAYITGHVLSVNGGLYM